MFEKTIEDLIVMNDFNNMSVDELKEKYCSTEESYKAFLNVFNRIFANKNAYSLIIYRRFNDIISMLSVGSKYGSEEERSIEKKIKSEIELDKKYDEFDSGQMLYCFMNSIGATKVKDEPSFNTVISNMLDSIWLLSSSGTVSKDDYVEYLNSCKQMALDGKLDKKLLDSRKIRDSYYVENPKMNLCHNINFLYAANFLIKYYKGYCTDEVLDTVSEVIEISQDESFQSPYDFNKKEYSKVADYTLQNIKRLKGVDRKKVKVSQKIKQFIQKKVN